MKKLLITLFAMALATSVFAQDKLAMKISQVKADQNGTVVSGPDQTIDLYINKNTPLITLVNDAGLKIGVSYKLVAYNSRRSENKNAGIKLKVRYVCETGGKKIETKVERMFFLKDDRSFDEKENFVVAGRLKSQVIKLNYTGELEN